MKLEQSSFICNHQQNSPMYIYTNLHNHNIQQVSPMHKFTKSHIQLRHNSSTIQMRAMFYALLDACGTVTSNNRHLMLQKKHHM